MISQNISLDQKLYHFVFMMSANEAIISKNNNEYILTIKEVDPKTLYMTARPGRSRSFLASEKFMKIWIENNAVFIEQTPQVAIIYSTMQTNNHHIANAIPLELFNPSKAGIDSWTFKLKLLPNQLNIGSYRAITLFIDWFPATECPKPIQLELPKLL